MTFEPAARHHGLAFIPLETHVVELWIDERWMDHPGAAALARLLGADGFRARVDLVGGYDLEGSRLIRTRRLMPADPERTEGAIGWTT